MKAVIYARYSSDSQREESIEGQIRECTAFAEKNGITILRHYIDRAYSAKTDNRPDFQEMIKDSGKKLFDMVIVWKLDRFARNRYDSARYKAQLKRNGVKVVSATEVISEGAEGIILESVLEGYAEYYSADLAEKVIRGRTDNALKCKFNGGTLPIGYIINEEQHFQIDPLTAPFVLDVFKKYDKGATMKELRDWLNDNGVRNTRGQPLNFNCIQHMLSNRRYIGEYKYRDIIVPDGIPAIVPEDLFDRVQEKLAQNRKAPARHKAEDDYLLTTKLFCGYCGAYLCGESGKSRNGTIHHYYKGLTQMQLAEKLNITNRAVSKWETGKSVPDVSLMLDLCGILGITVNELLSGERITMEDYHKKAEENLMELQSKKEKTQKECNAVLKILIAAFSLIFVLNMILNYFFPERNFNNLLGLPSIAIAVILLAKWFFRNYEIKLK